MTIPALPAEKRAAVEAALKKAGKLPTVAECNRMGTELGVSGSTVRRLAKRIFKAPSNESPAPDPKPTPAKGPAKPALDEAVSPAIKGKPSRPKVNDPAEEPEVNGGSHAGGEVFGCSECGTEWKLEAGEPQVNCCPGCSEPFA